eukprot:scaffold7729_cov172-Amphora_coffeaeformis.AAC.8
MEASLPPKRRKEPLITTDLTVYPDVETKAAAAHKNVHAPSSSSCCQSYWQDCVWPGLGLFGESYLLFSIGTLQPLWTILFPTCFVTHETCRAAALHVVSYGTVLGIIVGMVVVGQLAQTTGRRWGSILTAAFMTTGAAGLTGTALWVSTTSTEDDNDGSSYYSASEGMIWRLTTSLFLFGIGVGGEYPLAASSASEKAMTSTQVSPSPHGNDNRDDNSPPQQHRGRQIQLVFSMQGMGIFCNSIVLTALLLLYGQTTGHGTNEYRKASLLQIWQLTYAFGLAVLLYVLVSRYWYLEESAVWKKDKERRDQQQRLEHTDHQPTHDTSSVAAPGTSTTKRQQLDTPMGSSSGGIPDIQTNSSNVSDLSAPSLAAVEFDEQNAGGPFLALKEEPTGADMAEDAQLPIWTLVLKHYGARLMGSSLCWFLWDVAFYGNKLFQSSFLLALTGQDDDPDAPISLVAFSMAATLNAGVALMGYVGAAFLVDHPSIGRRQLQQWGFCLTGTLFVACGIFYHSLSSAALVTLYLGSSLFGQLGPNATTFVLPAEIFPTQIRTSCHGVAAAAGKVGALTAAIFFPMVESDLDLFLVSGYASLAASIVTFYTIPETTGLDLLELDRKWRLILMGRRSEYQGPANHPRFLSFYERQRWSARHHQHQQVVESDHHYNHAMDDY